MMIGDLEARMDGVLPRLGVGGVFGDGGRQQGWKRERDEGRRRWEA